MTPADQLKLLLGLEELLQEVKHTQATRIEQLEERVAGLERLVYRTTDAPMPPEDRRETAPAATPEPKREPAVPELQLMPTDEQLERMSLTELAQICQAHEIKANPLMLREDMVSALKNSTAVADKLKPYRVEMQQFIDVTHPSIKQVLRCSKQCITRCPENRVIDCWTSNQSALQEQ